MWVLPACGYMSQCDITRLSDFITHFNNLVLADLHANIVYNIT